MSPEQHPPVKDIYGRRNVDNGRDGWVPEDEADAIPMTWEALTQNVPGGELHVNHDHDKDHEGDAP